MATTTTTSESGAAAGVVGQLGGGTEGQGGTHAAEMLSPVFLFFLKSAVSRASAALGVDLTTYGMVEVALVT